MNAMSFAEEFRHRRRGNLWISCFWSVLVCITSEAAVSQQPIRANESQARIYTVGAQALGAALQEFAAQAGVQLLFSESDVAGIQTNGLRGSFTRDQALARLLSGSGLVFEFLKPDAVIIRRPGNSPDPGSAKAGAAAATAPQAASAPQSALATNATTNTDPSAHDPVSGGGSQSTADFNEVIVTGRAGVDQRTKEETSYSVTTIDQTKLRLQGPTSVTESLKSVPGFWVEASGGEASGNVRARGIPVDGFGSITLLEDGIPVQNDPALGYLNGDQAFRLDETIDRIEVVRGGPSSIFYSNAPAGAVNFIPRSVGDTPEGVLKYTVGDYGLNRVDVWYGAPVGDWKVGMGGFYRSDEGIRDPGYHGDDGGQFRVSLARDFEGGKISFDVKRLDDTVALDTDIPMYTDSNGKIRAVPGFNGNYGTVAGPQTAFDRMITGNGNDFLFDNTIGTQVKRTQATLNFQFEFADGYTFDDHARYDDTGTVRNGVYPLQLLTGTSFLQGAAGSLANFPGATSLQLRYTDSPGTIFNPVNQNGNGLVDVGGLRSVTAPVTEFMNDARVMHKFELGSQSHDVTLGFYVADVSTDFDRYSSEALLDVQDNSRLLDLVAVNAAGTVVGSLSDHGNYRYGYEWANATGQSTTTAFYLADEWQVTNRFRVDAGVRWEEIRMTANVEENETVNLGTPSTAQILTGSGDFVDFEQTFSKVGWTVGENWQFTDHSGLFARFTPTFRLPSLSTYTTATLSAANPSVATPIVQTMDLGEVGYKYANQWTDVYATAFWTKYNNVGFTNYVFNVANSAPPVPQTVYADTKTYGLELEGGLYPLEWFDLTYSATLQQPEYKGLAYTDDVNNAPVLRDYSGNQLIRVPKVSARIVPGFNLFNQRLRLQAAWEYEGARYVDTANSVVLPHYDVLNASARFSVTDHFDVYGYVDNVTNSFGLTEGNPRAGEVQSADAGANVFLARPILGRAFRLALMYRL
jgi:outer membrane receptor protein involved in Fe transport